MPINQTQYTDKFAVMSPQGTRRNFKYVVGGNSLPELEAKIFDICRKSFGLTFIETLFATISPAADTIRQQIAVRDVHSSKNVAKNLAIIVERLFAREQNSRFLFNTIEDAKQILSYAKNESNHYIGVYKGVAMAVLNAKRRFNKKQRSGSLVDQQNPNTQQNNNTQQNTLQDNNVNTNTPQTLDNNTDNQATTVAQSANDPTTVDNFTNQNRELDQGSIGSFFLREMKSSMDARTVANIASKNNLSANSNAIADSTNFSNSVDNRQRKLADQMFNLCSDISGILDANSERYMQALKSYARTMEQGGAELEAIAANNSSNSNNSLACCFSAYESLSNKARSIQETLSRCKNNFIEVEGEIVPANMLVKAIKIFQEQKLEEFRAEKEKEFLVVLPPKTQVNRAYNNQTSAISHEPKVKMYQSNTDLDPKEYAFFVSTHVISNLSDAIKYVLTALSATVSQPIVTTIRNAGHYAAHNQGILNVIDHIPSLQDRIREITDQDVEKRNFVSIKEMSKVKSYLSYNIPISIPKSIDKIDITTKGASVLESINNNVNQKISSAINSKIIRFNADFIETTSTLNGFAKPFPEDYEVSGSGIPSNAHSLDRYIQNVPDQDFKSKALLIRDKLNTTLMAHADAKSVIEKFRHSVSKLDDVSVTSYDQAGPIKSLKPVKEILTQELNRIEQQLDLQRLSYISTANQAILGMFNKAKIEAIENTLETSSEVISNILKVLNNVKHLIPTQEEIRIEEAFISSSKKAKEISYSIVNHFLDGIASLVSFATIPFMIIDSIMTALMSSIKFASLQNISSSFASRISSTMMHLFTESIEAVSSFQDTYDTLMFKIEKHVPYVKLIAQAASLAILCSITMQNPQMVRAIQIVVNSLLPDPVVAANVMSPF